MGYGPPTISVNTVAAVAQNGAFSYTIQNRTNAAISYTFEGSTVPNYVLLSTHLNLASLSGSAPAGQETIIACQNKATIYQIVSCTLTNGSPVTVTLAGPAATVAVSTASEIAQSGLFQFTIKNTTSAQVTYSITGSTIANYILTYNQLFTDTATTATRLTAISAPIGDTIVYCKNTALIYQTVVCKIDGGTIQNNAVLAGPAATVAVSVVSSVGSPILQDFTFTFTVKNTTREPITFSMTSTQDISASHLYTGASSTYSLVNQQVLVGDTIIYCKNQGLSLQTVTCTVNSGTNPTQTAVLAGGVQTVLLIDGSLGNSYNDNSPYPISTNLEGTGGTVSIDASNNIVFSASRTIIYSNPTDSSPLALSTMDFEVTITAKAGSGYWITCATPSHNSDTGQPGFAVYVGSGQIQFHNFLYQGGKWTRIDWLYAAQNTALEYTFVCTRDVSGLSVKVGVNDMYVNYIAGPNVTTYMLPNTGNAGNSYPNATFSYDTSSRITRINPTTRADFGNVNTPLKIYGDTTRYVKKIQINKKRVI